MHDTLAENLRGREAAGLQTIHSMPWTVRDPDLQQTALQVHCTTNRMRSKVPYLGQVLLDNLHFVSAGCG